MRNSGKAVLFLLFFISFFIPRISRATHVMGSDIAWKCVGTDSFELIVHGYRDCNGIPLSGNNLNYFSADGTCAGTTSANPNVCCGTDITPVCSSSSDRCTNSGSTFSYGIQEWTITATVHLKGPCCKYTITWEECCRSGAITTGAAGNDFYVEGHLNRCQKSCDNSPYFTLPPTAIFCENQCIYYNMACIDPDRDANGRPDSLVYSFGQPLSSANSPIGYSSPYSDSTPLIYSGTNPNAAFSPPYCYGMHLDPATGELEFKATKPDVTVFVVVVDEYRRDSTGKQQLIGEIRRDMQIAIISCPKNSPPSLGGVNGGSAFNIKMCAGSQTCFTITSTEPDKGDTDVLTWSDPGTMAGATFVSNKKSSPTATFCWKPGSTDAHSYPFTFYATAKDQGCPVPGSATRAYNIYVYTSPPTATYSATVSKCGLVTFSAKVSSISPDSISSYTWTGDSTPGSKRLNINGKAVTYQYHTKGIYHYSLSVANSNGCSTIYSDSVSIPQVPFLKLPDDTTMCTGPTLNIAARYAAFSKKDTIKWSTGATGTNITAVITKDTLFFVYVKDTDGCATSDTMHIKTRQSPIAYTGPDQSVCVGQQVTLGGSGVSGTNYKWSSHTSANIATTSNLGVSASGAATIYILIADNTTNGCISTDSVTVTGYPVPVADAGKSAIVCAGSKVNLGTTATSGYSYQWGSTPTGFSSTASNPVATPLVTTMYKVTTTTGGTCSRSDSVTISVNPLPVADAGNDTAICSGTAITIGKSAVKGNTYKWTSVPSGFKSNSSDTVVKPLKTTSYILTVTNSFNCSKNDTDIVTVNPLPDPAWAMFYLKDNAIFYAKDSSLKASGYEWYFGDGDSATGYHAVHLYPSNKTYQASLRIISPADCKNELDSSLAVTESGIEQNSSNDFAMRVYPNPFSAITTLQYYLPAAAIVRINLMDITGKQFPIVQSQSQDKGLYQLDIMAAKYNLHSGIYILKIETGDGYSTREIVKF